VARRLAEELARPVQIGDATVNCGASVGLAFTPRAERVEALVGQADAALYAAKAAGKGHWREFVPGMSPGRPMAAAPG
jgi:predicted signal transduction protein with EAL and GGDEF domain